MKFPAIESTPEKYFLQYLTIINPVILKLPPMQLRVLAGLLFYYYEYRNHPTELRNQLLSSAATKKSIRSFINKEYMKSEDTPVSEGNFNNLIKELRKRKFVIGKNTDLIINPKYIISPEKDNNLTFNWNIK